MSPATTSCSAIALALLLTAIPLAQQKSSPELNLFPARPAWNQPLDAALMTGAAIDEPLAFFPLEDGRLVAWDLLAGAATWNVPGKPVSAPAAGAGLVFLAEAGAIRALHQQTGAVAWSLPVASPFQVPLVWDNGWLLATDDEGTLLALRGADGEVIWRQTVGAKVHAAPAMAADKVYVPLEDGRVVALDVATGAQAWERRLGGAANDILGLDDRIYVGSDDDYFYCLQPSTGEVAWRWRTGGDVVGMPVADDRRVYFVSKDNVLRALDRHSGAQRWQRPLPMRPTRGPVRAGELLLVSGLSPRVSTFSIRDGGPSTDLTAPGDLAAAPYRMMVRGLPQVVLVSRDVAVGTRVLAVRRTVDPPMNTPLPVLPGVIIIAKPGTPGDPTSIPHLPATAAAPPPPAPSSTVQNP